MGKDKRKTAHSENESSARDSNVIDAWFRLQKANSMTLLVTTIRSYHNTLNEDPLITLMNPRIPSAYTWAQAGVAPAAPSIHVILLVILIINIPDLDVVRVKCLKNERLNFPLLSYRTK